MDLLKIRWIEGKHIEADDLIGTYSKKFNEQGICVYIGSNDHDFMQLVCDHIFVLRGYHGNTLIYKEPEVMNKFGILPSQYVDYIALTGDSSDNIKGIKGIGKKRAVNLLSKHKNIKGIYQSLDLLPQQFKRLLHGNEDFLSKQKEFLEIKKNLNLTNRFKAKDYFFSREMVPDKMGKFLDRNWEKLT